LTPVLYCVKTVFLNCVNQKEADTMAKKKTTTSTPSTTSTPADTIPRTVGDIQMLRPAEAIAIGLDTKDGPEHPQYDPRIHLPLVEATVLDMMENGVSNPIEVNPVEGVGQVIIAGRRRKMHAAEAERRLQKTTWTDSLGVTHKPNPEAVVWIPARAVTGSDKYLFSRMMKENNLREEEGAVAQARKVGIMQDKFGATDDEVLASTGWSIGTLRNRRKLLKLPAKLLRDVEAGKITWLQALKVSQLPEDQQDDAVEETADANEEGGHSGARRARQAAAGGANADDAPDYGKRWMKAILNCDKAADLDEGAAKLLRMMYGEETNLGPAITSAGIRGLTACIKSVEEAKRKATVAKNEAAAKKMADKREAKAAAGKGKKAPTNKPTPPTPAPKLRKGKGKAGTAAAAE
jgi:ParB family chromosome partitioning protein